MESGWWIVLFPDFSYCSTRSHHHLREGRGVEWSGGRRTVGGFQRGGTMERGSNKIHNAPIMPAILGIIIVFASIIIIMRGFYSKGGYWGLRHQRVKALCPSPISLSALMANYGPSLTILVD